MIRVFTIILALVSGWFSVATAGEEFVTIGIIPAIELAAGDTVTVSIPVSVAAGYHVQANPAANEFLIPLELSLNRIDSIAVLNVEYPSPDKYRLEGTDEDLLTYHGTVNVIVTIIANPAAPPGEYVIKGAMGYQACDSRRCFFPTSVPVAISATVVEDVPD